MSEKAQVGSFDSSYSDYDEPEVEQRWPLTKSSIDDNRGAGGTVSSEKNTFAHGVPLLLLAEIQALLLPLSAIAASFTAARCFDGALAQAHIGLGIIGAIVASIIAHEFDLHSRQAIAAGRLKWREILATVSLSFLVLLCLIYLLKIGDKVSSGWIASWYILTLGVLFMERLGILLWARVLQAENRLLERVAVFGSAAMVERVLDSLFVKDRNLILSGAFCDSNAPVFGVSLRGGLQELIKHARSGACDRIIIALPSREAAAIREAVARLDQLPIDVQLAPDAITLPDISSTGLVLLDIQRRPLGPRGVLIKSAMDYFLGAIAFAVFAPAMIIISIAIKCDSAGPIFFVQRRNGFNQRVIRVLKFRSMTVAEDGPVVIQAVRGDKRITRVGRFLRRTSLDELPQLLNVLRGELSLVGPRPHAIAHNECYAQVLMNYAKRHKVKPGITGWAQVNGCRGETKTPEDMRKRVDLDLFYIENWSPWLDLAILVRTLIVPFHSPNAH